MMKTSKIAVGTLVLFTLGSFSILAQRGGGSPGFTPEPQEDHLGVDRRPCCRVIPPRRVLVEVLELTDEQLARVEELARQIIDTVGPLREELRMLLVALQEELESEDPDRCLIGELLVAIQNLKIEICETLHSFEDDFLEILTPEQQAKWEEIKDRFCRHHRDGPDDSGDARD